MKKNVGSVDRILRLLAAVGCVLLFFYGNMSTGWANLALVLAVVLGITAIIGFCPLYKLLGIDTTVAAQSGKI